MESLYDRLAHIHSHWQISGVGHWLPDGFTAKIHYAYHTKSRIPRSEMTQLDFANQLSEFTILNQAMIICMKAWANRVSKKAACKLCINLVNVPVAQFNESKQFNQDVLDTRIILYEMINLLQ